MPTLSDLYDTTNDEGSSSFMNAPMLQQADMIARRRAALLERAKMSANQIGLYKPPGDPGEVGGFQSAVTGSRVPGRQLRVSNAALATPLIAGLSDALEGRSLDADESGYERLSAAATERHMASMPDADSSPQQRQLWAAQGMRIPALQPLMRDYAKDMLIAQPSREAAQRWEQLKQGETMRHNKAMENKPASANYIPFKDDAGNYTGSFDSRTNTYFDAQGRPQAKANTGTPFDPNTPGVPQSINGAPPTITPSASTPTSPPAVGGGIKGTSSATYQKTEADQQKNIANSTKALSVLDSMPALFTKANSSPVDEFLQQYGWRGSKYTGKTTPAQDALRELELKGGELLKYADKGAYGPAMSESDTRALEKSVGDWKTATSISGRITAYNALVDTFRRNAGMPPLGDDQKLTIEKLTGAKAAPGTVTEGSTPVPGASILRQSAPYEGPTASGNRREDQMTTQEMQAELKTTKDPQRAAYLERYINARSGAGVAAQPKGRLSTDDLLNQYAPRR